MKRLLLVMVAACSAPAEWKRPELAETTRSQDDLIVRYEPDNTISVTVRVARGGVSASGFVFLRRSTLETAAQSEHLRLARARAWQTLAAMLVEPVSSFEAAKQGIDELSSLGVSEDSESVVRAERARTSNKVSEAAREMSAALRERLRGYVAKFHAEVR